MTVWLSSATAWLALAASLSATDVGAQQLRLPSPEVSKTIGDLPVVSRDQALNNRRDAPRELVRDPANMGPIGEKKLELGNDKSQTRPFVMPNSMIVQFSPSVTAEEIDNYLKSKNATVI